MTKVKNTAYIALGANLSNPKDNFRKALLALKVDGVDIVQIASLWHSPAWPAGSGHPDYVNTVVEVSAELSAEPLLDLLHEIEFKTGRERITLNAPRALDLDIIDFASQICATRPLLPHPRMLDRPFVLLPLLEIAPDWEHPAVKETGLQALAKLSSVDVLSHHIIEREWWDS